MARKPRQKPSLARRRRDPGLRSKLPMSQLTPAQQAMRKRNQVVAKENANPLYDPSTQLAGHSLIQAARDLADAQINPKVGALGRQLTSATTQGTALSSRAGDYYRQLAQREMQTVASQRALAGMLNADTAAIGAQSQAGFAQMNQAEQARQAQDASLRGPGLGGEGNAQVAREIAAQQGSAQQLQQAGAQSAAEHGSSWANLANAMAQSRQLRGGEVQGELLNRMANQQGDIRGKISDVEGQRGDLTTEALTKLRQQSFENLVTTKGLDIKQSDLQNELAGIKQKATEAKTKQAFAVKKFEADQAYKTGVLRIRAKRDPFTGKPLPKTAKPRSAADRLNDWKLDYARKHGYLPKTGPTVKPKAGQPGAPRTGAGSITGVAEQKIVSQVNKVLSWLQTPPSWPSGPRAGKPMTSAEVMNSLKRGGVLSGGNPIDPRVLNVASSLYHNKGQAVGPFGVKHAHDLGLHVGGRWKIKRK